jgi:hypothetical protein
MIIADRRLSMKNESKKRGVALSGSPYSKNSIYGLPVKYLIQIFIFNLEGNVVRW